MSPHSPNLDKPEVAEDEIGHEQQHRQHNHNGHFKEEEEIKRIDAMATAQGVTLESFAHLDEKKILRKV